MDKLVNYFFGHKSEIAQEIAFILSTPNDFTQSSLEFTKFQECFDIYDNRNRFSTEIRDISSYLLIYRTMSNSSFSEDLLQLIQIFSLWVKNARANLGVDWAKTEFPFVLYFYLKLQEYIFSFLRPCLIRILGTLILS